MPNDLSQTAPVESVNPKPASNPNQEWELSDLIRLVMSELDQAQDTLVLKSQNRRLSMMVNQLSFDLQVDVRLDQQGSLQFRTVPPGESGMTVLKLGFIPALDTQVQDIHKTRSLADDQHRPLEMLPRIQPSDIQALNLLGIDSVSEFEVATQAPGMLTQVSQKTSIPEWRLRLWRSLPFISEVTPEKGAPGSSITIDGGNFGDRPEKVTVFFQDKPASILQMTSSRLSVEMPRDIEGADVLVVDVDGQKTNTSIWTVAVADLCVKDVVLESFSAQNSEASQSAEPFQPQVGDEVLFKAILSNQGTVDAKDFTVQWTLAQLSEQGQEHRIAESNPLHGQLLPNEVSKDRMIDFKFKFEQEGTYRIKFIADPKGMLPDSVRTNNEIVKEFKVSAMMRPIAPTSASEEPAIGFKATDINKVTEVNIDGFQRLLLKDQAIGWSYRSQSSGYLYFESPDDESTWEFSPTLETDFRKLDKTTLKTNLFYGIDHPEGANAFGSRWEQGAIMVTEGQIIFGHKHEQPDVIYVIRFEKQSQELLAVNYAIA